MLDFLMITTRNTKQGVEVYPKFMIKKSNDLMIRGGDFYAIWVEERGLWSTDEDDVIRLVDRELDIYVAEHKFDGNVHIKYMWDADSGSIDKWHRYCQRHCRDWYVPLDEKLIFSNAEINKKDYASKRLSYPLEQGEINAWDKLISTLYSEPERHKIEWAIGAIVSGESKHIQKFMVLYGEAGTGKSTILNVIQQLFDGYYSVFDAKALGSASNAFALEAFKNNPLVAIQHDGDLSKIEDNTRLNSLVSHELMTVNEKFKSTYTSKFNAFLFMGTNKHVKITDAKSGLLRRLIDVTPSGRKLPPKEYKRVVKQVEFELGAIAYYCRELYLDDPGAYDTYIPTEMMGASNDFYNYIIDGYRVFSSGEGITMKAAWKMYNTYCEEAKVQYSMSRRSFKEELKNYFWDFDEVYTLNDGSVVRDYYSNFRAEKFSQEKKEVKEEPKAKVKLINFDSTESIFDIQCTDCLAQYATEEGTPSRKWDNTKTKLKELDTTKLHYVKVPENHIVIDFDIPDKDGNKCFEKNLEEASKWPATYAELSKSGAGIHLHYIYTGDVNKLSRVYDDKIEVKVFTGKSSLRRKLTRCNNLPIASISSGLPLKGDTKMVNNEVIKSEKGLRTLIKRNLNKEIHPGTKPSIDFIHKILEDAYDSGLNYDVSDMRNAVLAFGANSTNQADYCIKLVAKMKFKSAEVSAPVVVDDAKLVFFDIEVFPNLFLVNWKFAGEGVPVVRMINPKPHEIEALLKFRLVGFNNRDYDNHMLYGALLGYSNEQLYDLSTRIINKDKQISRKAKFGEAYNLSYTDVYDFAAKKQSLKKWEIELGIGHKELGLPWDQPVPKERWIEVAEYCDWDVICTEKVFEHLKGDFTARQILADLAGMTVNDKTNDLTARIIFGKERNPQSKFNYRFMGDTSDSDVFKDGFDEFTRFNTKGQPIFPGYTFDKFKSLSMYRGEEVGEGGYVYANPGMYGNIALLDIASMHPTSAIQEVLFGPYTQRFEDIKQARVYIKHKDFEAARHMLDGKLAKYLDDESTAKDLAQALKIAINSVYGMTSAKFANLFKDPRNDDNIVAKRGALFMINLKYEVQKRGFKVVHIKTDSIKIADATPDIIKFVTDYGKMYGYDFEHEATYDRMCLVNDAVYIAKDKADMHWTATGAQFAVPFVFKTLFSKEPIEFEDMCETKSVSAGAIFLDMNEGLGNTEELEKEMVKLQRQIKKAHDTDDVSLADLMDQEEDLKKAIDDSHNLKFVGRVGQFCPIKPGCGGGILYRVNDGKNFAVTGTKGYRWLESELVREQGRADDIDISYYRALVDDAVDTIKQYGDVEWFTSDDPYNGIIFDSLPDFEPLPEMLDIKVDYKNYY